VSNLEKLIRDAGRSGWIETDLLFCEAMANRLAPTMKFIMLKRALLKPVSVNQDSNYLGNHFLKREPLATEDANLSRFGALEIILRPCRLILPDHLGGSGRSCWRGLSRFAANGFLQIAVRSWSDSEPAPFAASWRALAS